MVRPTYAEIDLDAIRHNVAAFADLIAPSALCTVVKADAYGHGDVPVATAAVEAGAQFLAVALVEEGARLREAGIDMPIILLSEPPSADATEIARWDLQPTAYTTEFVAALDETGASMQVHVKVDTGMHRVGAPPERVPEIVERVRRARRLEMSSLWTHLSVADEDPSFTQMQIERFDAVAVTVQPPRAHLANTAGAALYPQARRDLCRVGLGTYGLHPCAATRDVIGLLPAMRVVTHVSHVQRLEGGERPSYGRVREIEGPTTVVTAPIGYADGFSRMLTSNGVALVGGRRCPLAGTVTMDQIVIDVGDADVDVGEEVVLMGSQAGAEVTADEWAGRLGTISYEVVSSIGPRVPRRFL
jgi:alanine racemase